MTKYRLAVISLIIVILLLLYYKSPRGSVLERMRFLSDAPPTQEYYAFMIAATNELYPPTPFPDVGALVPGTLNGDTYKITNVITAGYRSPQKKAYVAVATGGQDDAADYHGDIVIVFQGTASKTDWLHDAHDATRSWTMRRSQGSVTMQGKYHTGMLDVFDPDPSVFGTHKSMGSQILAAIEPYYHSSSQTIHITGHSLGAALCQLCGLYLTRVMTIQPTVKVTAFAAPHIGDSTSADVDFGNKFELNQVVVKGDPVPVTLNRARGGLFKRWVGSNGVLYMCRPDAPSPNNTCGAMMSYTKSPILCPQKTPCTNISLHGHVGYECMIDQLGDESAAKFSTCMARAHPG